MTSSTRIIYVHNLPYMELKELCKILDQNDKWEDLADSMKFDVYAIQTFRREISRGGSPCEELLNQWGTYNHTVEELFVLLSCMDHYEAMKAIKHLVDERLHRLIYEGEKFLPHVFPQRIRNLTQTSNSNNISNSNESSKIINVTPSKEGMSKPRVIIESSKALNNNNVISTDNNESKSSSPAKLATPQSPGKSSMMTISDISSVAENASIPKISYDELQEATNNWDKDNILGRGGFGTVFRGFWKNTEVAIKRIEQRGGDSVENYKIQMEQSLRELYYLNSCRHDNILSLYGFSMGGENPCLVYQFMSGGSLEQRLHFRKKHQTILNWEQRTNIARGTARGLQYLHTVNKEKPLIHGDIKSANILLDPCSHPRIGDFGLAREGPQSKDTHLKVSRVHGTRPYLPDEFIRTHNLSTKVDTYSFGVVLFELATGRTAYDSLRQYKFLTDFVGETMKENTDSLQDIKAEPFEQGSRICNKILKLGQWCVNKKAYNRPEMVVVLKELEKL